MKWQHALNARDTEGLVFALFAEVQGENPLRKFIGQIRVAQRAMEQGNLFAAVVMEKAKNSIQDRRKIRGPRRLLRKLQALRRELLLRNQREKGQPQFKMP